MPENGEEILRPVPLEDETVPAEPQPVVEVIEPEVVLPEEEINFRKAFADTLRSVRGGDHNKNLFRGYGPVAPGRAALANEIDEPHLERMARAHGFDKIKNPEEQRHTMFRYMGQYLVGNVERDNFSTIEYNENVNQKQEYLSDAYRMYRTNALLSIGGIAEEGQISGVAIVCCECIGAEVPWTTIRDNKQHFEKLGRGEDLSEEEQGAREKIQHEIQEILPDIYKLLAHYRVQYWSRSTVFAKDENAFSNSLNNSEPFNPLLKTMRRWGYDRSHNQDLNGIPVPSVWNEDPFAHQKEIMELVESWTTLQQEAVTKAMSILEAQFRETDATITTGRAEVARKVSEKEKKKPDETQGATLEEKVAKFRAARASLQDLPSAGNTYGPNEQGVVRSLAQEKICSEGYQDSLEALVNLYETPLPEQSRLERLFDRANSPKIQRENAIIELLKKLSQARMDEVQYLEGMAAEAVKAKQELTRQNDVVLSESNAIDREVKKDTTKIEAAEENLKKVTESLKQAQVLLGNLTEKLSQLELEKARQDAAAKESVKES